MNTEREKFIDVNLKDVTPIFSALLFGTVLSIFLLLAELYVKQRRTNIYQKT